MTDYDSRFPSAAPTGNGHILVVDDEPGIRRIVRGVLEKAGYHVLEADNGEAAIEAINTGDNRLMLDAVICDIRMPKLNGLDAIAYFRHEFPHLPLIVLTGYPDSGLAFSCVRMGVTDYLVKPVEGEQLRAAVKRASESRYGLAERGPQRSEDSRPRRDVLEPFSPARIATDSLCAELV